MTQAGCYRDRRVLVAGTGVAGAAAAQVLLAQGAQVWVLDRMDGPALQRLGAAGAAVVVDPGVPDEVIKGVDEVVVSPGFAPDSPVALAARAHGLPIYSEPELAWRLRPPGAPPWLAITGTNGKTTTTTMLAAILKAAGLRSAALGNIGEPLVFAATDPASFDVLAVELSSQQLHWSSTLAPQAGALLNLAEDHLEWHGSYRAYCQAKTEIWRSAAGGTGVAVGTVTPVAVGTVTPVAVGTVTPVAIGTVTPVAVGNLDDPSVAAALAAVAGRRVGVRLAEPAPGQLGVVDGCLVDHAFTASPVQLAQAGAVRPSGAHNVSNALHAAALARWFGVTPAAVAAGLAGYVPEPHRNAWVARLACVAYVDDSKATNPHAAHASLTAYPRVVWIAGGQLKGVDVDPLVASVATRLAGVVLLGVDRGEIAAALARHASGVPVVDVARTDDGAMAEVVSAAAQLAHAGDTVLLAPAAASKDMFVSYVQRGERFAAAVRAMKAAHP